MYPSGGSVWKGLSVWSRVLTCVLIVFCCRMKVVECQESTNIIQQQHSQLQEVFLLYGIPVLDVTLYYFDFPKAQDDVHLQDLIAIGQDIDRITSQFLFTHLETSLVSYTQNQKLHSVELDVVVRLVSANDNNNNNQRFLLRKQPQPRQLVDNTNYLIPMIRSELSGHAAFTTSSGLSPNNNSEEKTLSKSVVKNAVLDVFSTHQDDYLKAIQTQSQIRYLQETQDVQIRTSPTDTSSTTTTEPITSSTGQRSNGFNTVESAAVFGMGAALVVIVAGSYVYLSNQYHIHRKKRKRHNAGTDQDPHPKDEVSLMKNMETSPVDMEEFNHPSTTTTSSSVTSSPSKSSSSSRKSTPRKKTRIKSLDEQNAASSPHFLNRVIVNNDSYLYSPMSSSNPAYNGTGGDSTIVPVPAKRNNSIETTTLKKIPARRYVQAASPFDVLYGAAFLHHDHERLQKNNNRSLPNKQQYPHTHTPRKYTSATSRNSKKKNKYSPKTKGGTPLRPMMSIAESIDEGSEGSTSNPKDNYASFFPHLMNNITMYLGADKQPQQQQQQQKYGPVPSSSPNVDADSSSTGSSKGKKDLIVYRDFPRHDGTPFVMFTPENEGVSFISY